MRLAGPKPGKGVFMKMKVIRRSDKAIVAIVKGSNLSSCIKEAEKQGFTSDKYSIALMSL